MKKSDKEINLFDISQIEHKSTRSNKIKTTDINILLNRIRQENKSKSKKTIFLLFSIISILSFISFIVFVN